MSKNEILNYINKPELKFYFNDNFTSNDEMKQLMKQLDKVTPFEKPDAYLCHNKVVYAIEHFQISQYSTNKNGDISKIAIGSKLNRDKMKNDRDFALNPCLNNLLNSLKGNLLSHSQSFTTYKENITSKISGNFDYRLVIFIEDSTESAYIVKDSDNRPVNPLEIRELREILLNYKDNIWGVVYSYGNEQQKEIVGSTTEDLMSKIDGINVSQCRPLETERKVHVSKENKANDTNHITIVLNDRLGH